MKCDTCKMKRVCDELERMGKVPKHEKCRCYSPAKPVTNADRIRAMSDEELADELLEWYAVFSAVEWTKDMILDWLKREAE